MQNKDLIKELEEIKTKIEELLNSLRKEDFPASNVTMETPTLSKDSK